MPHKDPHHPHAHQPILYAGTPLASATAAVILLHGRGAGADDILGLAPMLSAPGVAFLAPAAVGSVWYPQRFIAPLDSNEPYLSSALRVIQEVIADLTTTYHIPLHRIAIGGFSQGACLSLEYAARHPAHYGAILGFSGALIGPPQEARAVYPGSLAPTPVFIACSDVDYHIPLPTVLATTVHMRRLGAQVIEKIYPGMGHQINQEEITIATQMIVRMAAV